MKRKELIIVIGIVLVLLLVIIITRKGNNRNEQNEPKNTIVQNNNEEYVVIQEDGSKKNTSEKLAQTKTIEGITISNIRLTESGGMSKILADLKNETNKKAGGYPVTIMILNKNGETVQEVTGYIDEIEAGKSAQLNAAATVDFANAYDFTIEKK